jgi:L-malate glycosyltransferase
MKNRKLLVIGPSSTHVDRFIGLVKSSFDEMVFIGEEQLKTNHDVRQILISFRSLNPFTILKNRNRLKKIIQNENPTIVHIQQVNRVAFIASGILKKLQMKFVVTAWGTDVLVIPKKNPVYKGMTISVLKRADAVTADSKDMIEAIKILSPETNTELIFFGVVPLGFEKKEKIIYSNRSLYEIYRIDKIIEEFASFSKTHPEWKLFIAGTGPLESALKNQVENLKINDAVTFKGWLTPAENNELYQRAAIYVSMPESDGTSVSVLEAMSAGCIPVLSDIPVSYEWVENHKNGIIKSTGKNAFDEALHLDQTEATQYNIDLIHEQASAAIAGQKLIALYQKILHD